MESRSPVGAVGAVDGREHARRAEQMERLLEELAALSDAQAREKAEELVGMLLGLYGEGLERLLALTADAEGAGLPLIHAFAADEVVGPLLLLHGLHPVPLEARITGALDEVRPYLRSHGGNVTLVGVTDGVARLQLEGSCHGCPSSTVTLKLAIEEALAKAAPDLERLEVEGVVEPPPKLITLTPARRRSGATGGPRTEGHPAAGWTRVREMESLPAGTLRATMVRGRSLVFCRFGETFYAYANRCAGCDAPLETAALDGTLLTCAGCGARFDVARAGRALDAGAAPIEPVLLLVEGGALKVALPADIPHEMQPATTVPTR